ncbi:hemagglutinin/amebocyte aggregation factor-like isoform X2 [Argopecten irradians]|uniref:hemagglutinin/amebocyte aggregation factor-like isoform X2 n=1 Tax=Argopecten irradians TaxID=31199 RepID=UPI0037123662
MHLLIYGVVVLLICKCTGCYCITRLASPISNTNQPIVRWGCLSTLPGVLQGLAGHSSSHKFGNTQRLGGFYNMKVVVCILLAGLSVATAFLVDTVDSYDHEMDFSCAVNTTLRHLHSHHDNHHEDRIWSMGCYPAVAPVYGCQWTSWVNGYDQAFDFECPDEGFINGVRSRHDNNHEDRVWAFQCCKMKGLIRNDCTDTGFVNRFDGDLSFTTHHDNQNIHGWISVHDNDHEDRIFDFMVCDYVEGEPMLW